MNGLLEKVTLYDILGYLFPGCIMNLMVLVGLYHKYENFFGEIFFGKCCFKEYTGGFYLAFFGVSYLAGLALSELSTLLVKLFCKLFELFHKYWLKGVKEFIGKFRRRQADEGDGATGVIGVIGETGIPVDKLVEALEKSGVADDRAQIKQKILDKGWKVYKARMYGAIQYKGDYKRIHNYASMKVLCKNLAMALIVGEAVLCVCGLFSWFFCAVVAAVFFLLASRGIRFGRKKNMYTVIWFTDMMLKDV